jgi:ribonuclease P protein component
MKKQNTIQKNSEFNKIINTGRYEVVKGITLYYEKITTDNYYFGISVGKKLGNAVLRNKIKRQIKTIIDKNKYENGYNCIIMIKKAFVDLDFEEKSSLLISALLKIGMVKVDCEKK